MLASNGVRCETFIMKKSLFIFSLCLTSVGILSAAQPVATISSGGTFTLRGVSVNTMGVSRWPVMVGDTFESGSSTAVVQFRDGSKVAMSEGSKAVISGSGDQVSFRLVSGSMQVAPVSGTKVAFSQSPSSSQSNDSKGISKNRVFGVPVVTVVPCLSSR